MRQTNHSKLDNEVILYARHNQGVPFSTWPEHLQKSKLVDALCKRDILRRCYEPERYFLTRTGFEMASLLISSAEMVPA